MAQKGWKDAIVTVLKQSNQAMHYADIAEAIIEQGLRKEVGATPAASVNATITMSIKNDGEQSPFLRVDRGYVVLKESGISAVANKQTDNSAEETGLINAFGMFWRRDWVFWSNNPKLLGQQPGSNPVDFAGQKGVYLLYDGRSVVYVGRVTDQSLGRRLLQHTTDRLNGRWDRFSWFGICQVREDGSLKTPEPTSYTLELLILTMEAVLIEGLEPPQNRKRGDDFRAVEFLQVEDPELRKTQLFQLMDALKSKI